MIQNVGAFTRNTEFALFLIRGKMVSAMVLYFRPCFSVTFTCLLSLAGHNAFPKPACLLQNHNAMYLQLIVV